MNLPSISRRAALRLALGASLAPSLGARATDRPADVIVIGAGMAGLHAARMLQAAGLDVTVLEASQRVGGRCWTARQVPGRPELGAAQVGHNYGRVRGNAAELGVELSPPPAGAPSSIDPGSIAISIDGHPALREPWATSSRNRLAAAEKAIVPLQLFPHYLNAKDPFVDLGDWLKPEFAPLDRMSLRSYFASLGASPEALRLLDVNVSARNLDEANALDALRKNHFYRWEAKSGAYSSVKEGMSALTDAMAASLAKPVALGKVVRRIETAGIGVTLTCNDGSAWRARAAITTIPLSVFRDIGVVGAVPAAQREAWRSIAYTHLVQVFLLPSAPFWDKDGMTPELWTDGPIERVLRLPAPGTPHGLLAAFINGQATDPLDRMALPAVGEFVRHEFERLRPAAAGTLSVVHVHNWSNEPFARGHVSGFRPGDIGRFEPWLARPIGALYFAGEHCGKLHVGIEAACESAEAAVTKLLEDIA